MSASDTTAQLACQERMVQSYRLIDDGHAGQVAELFTEDGRFTIAGAVDATGKEALSRLFAAREEDKERRTRHCLTNLSFTASSANEAIVRATLLLFVLGGKDATTPEALADVEDRYRLEDGIWRIAARTTTLVAGGA